MQTSLHRRDWEEMANVDPLWAILSHPAKRFRNWEMEEFLHTGEAEVSNLMESANRAGFPRQRRYAIDFGCGVGRLTLSLRKYFPVCFVVDILSSMLDMAWHLCPDCNFQQAAYLSRFP